MERYEEKELRIENVEFPCWALIIFKHTVMKILLSFCDITTGPSTNGLQRVDRCTNKYKCNEKDNVFF